METLHIFADDTTLHKCSKFSDNLKIELEKDSGSALLFFKYGKDTKTQDYTLQYIDTGNKYWARRRENNLIFYASKVSFCLRTII